MKTLWGAFALTAIIVLGTATCSSAKKPEKPAAKTVCKASDFPANGAEAPVALASGVWIQTLKAGEGRTPSINDYAVVRYKGMLRTGKVFDESASAAFPVSGLVPGFTEGLLKMQAGGSYRLCLPADQAYGAESPDPSVIPNNALLLFDVGLLDIRTADEQ